MAKFASKKRSAIALQSPEAIDYSVQMHPNGMNENDPERAYASLQYAGTVKLEQLASHISEHGSPYTRDTIVGVATALVDCIREHVMRGFKVEIGDLGTFKLSIKSKGAETADKFTTDHIISLTAKFRAKGALSDLRKAARFNRVPTRKAQAATLEAQMNGQETADWSNQNDDEEDDGE